MRVTATQTYRMHLGFVRPHGVDLPASTDSPNYVDIDDIYADNPSMISLLDSGKATIGGFNKDASEEVGQTEINEHVLGIYTCSGFSNIPGAISGGTSCSILAGATEPYDLRAKNYFKFFVDGDINDPVYEVTFYITKGIYNATSLAATLNNNATFTEHLVATVSGGNKALVETRSKGASSFVIAQIPDLAAGADANDYVQFPTVTPTTAPTGTATRIVFNITGPTGSGLHRARVNAAAFTTDYGSGDTPTAGAFVQVARKGTIVTGLYSAGALALLEADENGDVDVEIADVTHADTPVWLGLLKPSGYGATAVVPTARTSVVNS